MSLCPTGDLVTEAREAGRAVAAFNVITLEHVEAVVAGVEQAGFPAIVQVSENAVRFRDGDVLPLARAAAACADASSARLSLHLDHVKDGALLRRAADAGFSSVMFDAGAAPYDENVRVTREARAWAHERRLWVEAELGYVGGKPDAPASAHDEGVRTDPREAAAFVAETGVDALAVAVGSSHAMTERTARLDHDLIRELAAGLDVPLVLHGSSGVPDDELRRAVAAGMTKVNIGTALNLAFTTAVRDHLGEHRDVSDPRKYLREARDAMASAVAHLTTVVSAQPVVTDLGR
jgi:fructose-bisphosphate aldolase class II